jgi:hypothetical protein
MYALKLTESYCPAQAEDELHDSTVGSLPSAAAARTITDQKVPTRWIAATEWPLTGSGNTHKLVLRVRWVAFDG